MRKIIGFILHRNFEKSYIKQTQNVQKTFRERRNLLLIDREHQILNTHPLHGKWKNHWSINITGDIRAIFRLEGHIAIFLEIGPHNQLYG